MRLKLYNEHNNKVLINVDEKNKIGSGIYATVYLINGYAFKKFKCPLSRLEKGAFLAIKDIEHPNLYKVKELFYDSNTLENLRAYSMKYYGNDDINILTMPTEYTLDNLSDLHKLATILANKHIIMSDLHTKNVIMQRDRIILIDRDNDYYCTDNCEMISYHNDYVVKDLLIDCYLKQLKSMYKDNESLDYRYKAIISHLTSCTFDEFRKLMLPYNRPIDYVESKIKRF